MFRTPVLRRRAAEQPGVGEEAGVRDHAVVGPHRLALDVPAALEHLERLGHAEGRLGEQRLAQLRDLGDLRRVGEEDPARVQRPRGVLHDLPRLGQVEHDAVEVGLVDALVAVAHLDAVAVEHLVAEEARDVLDGPGREVVAELVARRLSAPARSRVIDSAPDPTPDSSTRAPGKMSASMQDRAEVLRVDDLRAARHLQHEVGQRRPDRPCRCIPWLDRTVVPSARADDGVVADDAGVGVELLAGGQREQVAALLRVDEQDLVTRARTARLTAGRSAERRRAPATSAVARSTSRQNAHTSPGVGAPHAGARLQLLLLRLAPPA